MSRRNLSSMPVLSQYTFKSMYLNKSFVKVAKDYNLNGQTIEVPDIKVLFCGGSFNNGKVIFKGSLLENVEEHAIDAVAEGTLANSTVKMSWFGDVNRVKLLFSNQIVEYDTDATITDTVVVPGNNIIYDGKNHNFICQATFFKIYGKSNITIKNFNAVANNQGVVFEEMITTAANVTGIEICDNNLSGFQMGISLNNDSATYFVSNSSIHDNSISNCLGTGPGHGYGIHLANVRNSSVTGNIVSHCERHAIYHAYGENNAIEHNVIHDHCSNVTTYNLLAALEIGRRSKNVSVKYNTFANNNNICILVYSPLPLNDGSDGVEKPFRYGKCEGIVIEGNRFYPGGKLGLLGNLPYIWLGVSDIDFSTLSANGTLVDDVHILGNTFQKYYADNQLCVRVNQCEYLEISGNEFKLGLPSLPQENEYIVIDIPTGNTAGYTTQMMVENNTFGYLGSGTGNLYLLGEDMSLINSSYTPNYTIIWYGNTLQNQIVNGVTKYTLSKYTPGNNVTII